MTQTQLITALTTAQKNKKLTGAQITQVLRAYGYNDPLTKYQKTITTPIKKTKSAYSGGSTKLIDPIGKYKYLK